MRKQNYWLFKSEPATFSIADLKNSPKQITCWDGVRNYQARNFFRDNVEVGDGVFFHHSNANPRGIAGEVRVVKKGYPDPSQFDPRSQYYDKKSSSIKPIWYSVDVKYVSECKELISLRRLAALPKLGKMWVLKRGLRLSIQPVSLEEWNTIRSLPEWKGIPPYGAPASSSPSSKLMSP